jgi:hypothetical protein
MLNLFTLQVFETIFETRSENKLSSMAKSLYINCLYGYFKGKEATDKNSMAFDIFLSDLKNYSKWQKYFQELHKAKLINIQTDRINFINHWGQFIEREKLTKPITSKKDANSYRENLQNNKTLIDLIAMKQSLNETQINNFIDLFVKEQEAVLNKYNNESEISKHFMNWCNTQVKKSRPVSEKVKSKAKILGQN